MPKTLKYATPLIALAIALPLAVSTVSLAATIHLAESGMGTQRGPVIMGAKATPKRAPTHSVGLLKKPPLAVLRGPELRESGMGRLIGVEQQGDHATPRRAPTLGAKPI